MMAAVRRRRKKPSEEADILARIDTNIRKGIVAPGERQLGIDAYAANARGLTYGQYKALQREWKIKK